MTDDPRIQAVTRSKVVTRMDRGSAYATGTPWVRKVEHIHRVFHSRQEGNTFQEARREFTGTEALNPREP